MPGRIVLQKTGAEKEHNCHSDVNVQRNIVDCLVDTGSTISIISTHLVKKYNLQTTRTEKGILANQTKGPLTLRGKCSLSLKIGNIINRGGIRTYLFVNLVVL